MHWSFMYFVYLLCNTSYYAAHTLREMVDYNCEVQKRRLLCVYIFYMYIFAAVRIVRALTSCSKAAFSHTT